MIEPISHKFEISPLAAPIVCTRNDVEALLQQGEIAFEYPVKLRSNPRSYVRIYRDKQFGDFMLLTMQHRLGGTATRRIKSPYRIGDILYVKESCAVVRYADRIRYLYQTSDSESSIAFECMNRGATLRWRNPSRMPKRAARLILKVMDVQAKVDADYNSSTHYLWKITVEVMQIDYYKIYNDVMKRNTEEG